MPIKSYRIIVKGIVQGVNFRNFTKLEADKIGIKGYVRNVDNGNVEVFLEGEADNIEKMISAVSSGPPYAEVNGVELHEQSDLSNFEDFRVVR